MINTFDFKKVQELKGQIDSINVTQVTRDMFIAIFKQDFNPKMVNIMKNQGIYLGDPDNVTFKKF